jgi:hypothetical protein
MQTSRVVGKGFSFLLVLVLFFLWNVAPLFSQQKPTLSTTQAKPKLKSESKAKLWSIFSTLAPAFTGGIIFAVQKHKKITHFSSFWGTWTEEKEPDRTLPLTTFFTGVVFGPAVGYFYAGEETRGLTGIGIRGGLGLIMFAGILGAKESFDLNYNGILLLSIPCSIVLLVFSAYDIGKVESWVKKHNDQLLKTGLIFSPKYFAQTKALGVELKFTF